MKMKKVGQKLTGVKNEVYAQQGVGWMGRRQDDEEYVQQRVLRVTAEVLAEVYDVCFQLLVVESGVACL